MAEIDAFAAQLLEEAKAFLEKGRNSAGEAKEAFLHASLNLAFCALEAHVNAIAEDFLTMEDLSAHELSLLSEKKVELSDGTFRLTTQMQIYRIEDRILFLCHRFSKKSALDKTAAYWSQFKDALGLRNNLTHPKTPATVNQISVERALLAILQLLDVVYKRIYGKRYPPAKRGLDSTIELP